MRAKEVLGKEVIDADARVVGKIADIELDVVRASVVSITVKSGLIKRISIPLEDVDKIGDKVVLKVAKEKIWKGQS
jgi:sporulation protein YlmC with PRC-barrel domain